MVARIDHTDTLSVEERHGVVRKLVRKARVVELFFGELPVACGYQKLYAALLEIGIPLPGSRLDSTFGQEWGQLTLIGRDVQIVSGDPGTYDVTLTYEHQLDGAHQDLGNPSGNQGKILAKHRSSIQQVTTNKYKDENGNDQLIVVSHTFPDDDKDKAYAGKKFEQGGEIHVYQPQKNVRFEGFIDIEDPTIIEYGTLASVNKNFWMNHNPREWLCTEVVWEGMRTFAPSRYKFGFEFQHNPDGWDPNAVFIDPRTGKPPKNLVKDVGFKTIKYLREVNFNVAFAAMFEGFQQLE